MQDKVNMVKNKLIPHYGKDKPAECRERELQKACFKFLGYVYPKVFAIHIPNEGVSGKGGLKYGAIKKQEGVKAGMPDVLIFENKGGFNGFAVELKVKGGKISKKQLDALEGLKMRDWNIAVVWNIDAFIEVVNKYMKQ